MASLSSLAGSMALTLLAGGLVAQDTGQAVSIDARSRVARALKGLARAPSFECRTTIQAKASPFVRQMGGGRTSKKRVTTVKEGDTVCWSKDDGDEVLARRGGRWALLDRDGDWIPCRKPEGSAWKNQFLADPAFLADRLLHLLPKTKWRMTGSKDIGDKAVRVYACKVDLDEANHLVRTGALPEGGGLSSVIGRVIMVRGVGGGAKMPEPEREIEVELYEDPATRLPLRIVVRNFSEGGALAGMQVAIQGIGGGDDDEDEEDETKKKKKPAYTIEYELSKVGAASATLLTKEARAVLGGK